MPYSGHYISDSDVSTWPSGTSDVEKQAAIETAEAILERALGVHYYPKAFDMKLNGNGKYRLFIPLASNILTVSSIHVGGIEMDSTWWTWDANSVFIDLSTSGAGVSNPELDYLLSAVTTEGIFPRGYNNIRVVGTCGPAAVPAWIKKVARILVDAVNDPSLYTPYVLGSESIGNYSYSTGSGPGLPTYKTGIKEADEIIQLFRRKKIVIMAP
jgi:hypothetical protein